jgi:predicted SAM-dependent methyltransferase
MCRVLKPGGVLRTTQPNLESLIDAYNRNEIRGQAWNPRNKCHLINEGLRLWEHKHVYDFEDWEEALKEAGFTKAYRVGYHTSEYPELCKLEWRPFYGELIVEAVR